jgi:hypothetical protein
MRDELSWLGEQISVGRGVFQEQWDRTLTVYCLTGWKEPTSIAGNSYDDV